MDRQAASRFITPARAARSGKSFRQPLQAQQLDCAKKGFLAMIRALLSPHRGDLFRVN